MPLSESKITRMKRQIANVQETATYWNRAIAEGGMCRRMTENAQLSVIEATKRVNRLTSRMNKLQMGVQS